MGRTAAEVQDLAAGLVYRVTVAAAAAAAPDTCDGSGSGSGSGSDDGSGSSDDDGVRLVCPAIASTLAPEEVSAQLLRHLLQLASAHLGGHTPQQVVITVPAYFTPQQRAATLAAARLAGVQQASLLQEPVAAALAFGFGKQYDADTLLVFDLGGGTFDLSVVDSFEGIMEVLGTGGNALLGGDDFDQALLHWLLLQQQQQCEAAAATDSSSSSSSSLAAAAAAAGDAGVLARLLASVEAAKCQLSSRESVSIAVGAGVGKEAAAATSAGAASQGQQQQQQQQVVELTRQQMHVVTAQLRQQLWQPLVPLADDCKLAFACPPDHIEARLAQLHAAANSNHAPTTTSGSNGTSSSSSSATQPTAAAAAAAGQVVGSEDPYAPKPRQLTAVLLVGGATRMPIIQQGLRVLTGLEPRCDVDPEQAVALGAAIQAAVLLGLTSGVELMDGSYVEGLHDRRTGF